MGCNALQQSALRQDAPGDSLKSRLHCSCFDYNRINSSEQKRNEMVSNEMLSQTTIFPDNH